MTLRPLRSLRRNALLAFAAVAIGGAIPGRAFPEYRVWVNGRSVEVLDIPAPSHHDWQLPDEAAQPYWAALFDAEGEVTVRVVPRCFRWAKTRQSTVC